MLDMESLIFVYIRVTRVIGILDICDIFEIFAKVAGHKNFSLNGFSFLLKILKIWNVIFQMRRFKSSE